MKRLLNTIIRTIEEERLLEKGDRVLLAVSGGPDSVFLAHVFKRVLAKRYRLTLHIAHLNHGLRGGESDRDEVFVRDLARELNVPCVTARTDVAKRRRPRQSLEEAGREVRYAFLLKTAKKLGCNKIATAHHRDDQVETFFLRLFRGTGARGLRGLLVKREDSVIRPLIGLEKRDVVRYLRDHRLPCRLDSSNANEDFLRNRIRRKLVPFIVRHFGRGVIKGIYQTQKNLSAGRLPPPRAKKRAAPPPGKKPAAGPEVQLKYPGRTAIPAWGLEFTVTEKPATAEDRRSFPAEDAPEAVLDASRLRKPLRVRAFRPGDRFQPLGGPGRKKLGDFFTDRKIPPPQRASIPLVCDRSGIAWVVGHRLGHVYRIVEKTRRICHIICARSAD